MLYIPNTLWTWSFISIVFIQGCIVLALEIYAFVHFEHSETNSSYSFPSSKTIPTYLALYIFAVLYQLVLTWDALRLRNTIQIIVICIYNLALTLYGGLQTIQIRDALYSKDNFMDTLSNKNVQDDIQPVLAASACTFAVGSLLLGFAAWRLYDEFAWTIYKHISADLRMRRRYLDYQIYIALLKLDFFFFLGFTIQFLVIVGQTTPLETGLTGAAIPVTIVVLIFAAYFTRLETKSGMGSVLLFYVAGLAYFFSKLVRMYMSERKDDYIVARKSLTTFAVITIILLLITIGNAVKCTMNFDKGLKPYLQGQSEQEKAYDAEVANNHALGPIPNRMVIE